MITSPSLDENIAEEAKQAANTEPVKASSTDEEPQKGIYEIVRNSLAVESDKDPYDAKRDRTTEREMLVDLICAPYFKILNQMHRIEWEVYRQVQIWQQTNSVMARYFGLKA